MLLMALVTLCLLALAVAVVARGTQEAMRRLGLDPMGTLLWLGLAEQPLEPLPPRHRRLEAPALERRPPRHGRSPDRPLVSRPAARRA